jgi:hypothetical protein
VQYAAAVCELSQVEARDIVELVIKHPRLCRLNFALPENECWARIVLKRDDWEHVSAEVVIHASRLWVRGTVRDDSDGLDVEERPWYLPKYWNSIIRVAVATSCSGFDDRTDICSYPISNLCVFEPGYDRIEVALDKLTEDDTLDENCH